MQFPSVKLGYHGRADDHRSSTVERSRLFPHVKTCLTKGEGFVYSPIIETEDDMPTRHIAAYYWNQWVKSGGEHGWRGPAWVPVKGDMRWFEKYWRECDVAAARASWDV